MKHLCGERGQGLVEFAVVFPIFVLFLFIVIDGGVLMGRYSEINHAADEGARFAAAGADPSDIVTHIEAHSQGLLTGASQVCPPAGNKAICIQWLDGPNGEEATQVGSLVRVRLKYRYSFITPLPAFGSGLSGIDVTSCAVARLERPNASLPASTGSATC